MPRIKRKEAKRLGVPIARNPNLKRALHNLKKDRRKRNAIFEGPRKNSGSDMRLAKNKEKRSI